jgi:flagellar basal-body rod modification protein FlgD
MAITASNTNPAVDRYAALNGTSAPAVTENEAGSADRFLKLLVAQMKNQDPLNPMDNAQVTSQMAQINTVDGISKLNETVKGLNSQFVQLQALQGAALVGRSVSVKGDRLAVTGEGEKAVGEGGFELSGPADSVRLEILSGAGRVVATEDLGSMTAGRHSFEWKATGHTDGEGLRYRVVATRGAAEVTNTPLMLDRVLSVSAQGDKMQLELDRSGLTDYASVVAVHGP